MAFLLQFRSWNGTSCCAATAIERAAALPFSDVGSATLIVRSVYHFGTAAVLTASTGLWQLYVPPQPALLLPRTAATSLHPAGRAVGGSAGALALECWMLKDGLQQYGILRDTRVEC